MSKLHTVKISPGLNKVRIKDGSKVIHTLNVIYDNKILRFKLGERETDQVGISV